MNHLERCEIAGYLAKVTGADHEDPAHPRWCHEDDNRSQSVDCHVRDHRVELTLHVTPDDAERVLISLAAGHPIMAGFAHEVFSFDSPPHRLFTFRCRCGADIGVWAGRDGVPVKDVAG